MQQFSIEPNRPRKKSPDGEVFQPRQDPELASTTDRKISKGLAQRGGFDAYLATIDKHIHITQRVTNRTGDEGTRAVRLRVAN
jgi:hypothetical protein